jgi:hypothetical protein
MPAKQTTLRVVIEGTPRPSVVGEAAICAATSLDAALPDTPAPGATTLVFRYPAHLGRSDMRAISLVLGRLGFETFEWELS